MKKPEPSERVAPAELHEGEELLWQGIPAAPPRIPARPAHAIVTLASAFGFFAFWAMVPELPAFRIALIIPIVVLIAMAAYPPLTARRRAKAFFHSARYTLTNRRAISAHAEKTTEIPLSATTKIHLKDGPLPALILWNSSHGAPSKSVYFHQLENADEPYKIVQNLQDALP